LRNFSIAGTDRWKDKNGELQERTEWFAIKAFGRRAEIVGEFLHKGSRVYLKGRERTESWEDKKTGGMNYRDLVYVDRIEFLVLEVMAIAVRGRTNAEASETQF